MREKKHCPVCEKPNFFKYETPELTTPYYQCFFCDVWYQSPLPPKLFEAPEEKGQDGRSGGHEQPQSHLDGAAHLARAFAHNWILKVPPLEGRPFYKTLDIGAKYPYLAHILKMEFQINAYGLDGMDFDSADIDPIVSEYQQELMIPMLLVDFEKTGPETILAATTDAGQFDAITLVHVFEHMYDPQGALIKISALLRPEGVLFIRLPSHDVVGKEEHLTARHYPIHPYFHSEKSIRYLLERTGLFSIVETYPMGGGTRDFILKKA